MLDNSEVAELLALQAEHAPPPANRALRRASRRAFSRPEEASDLLEPNRSLTELTAVAPHIERVLTTWTEKDEPFPTPPKIR